VRLFKVKVVTNFPLGRIRADCSTAGGNRAGNSRHFGARGDGTSERGAGTVTARSTPCFSRCSATELLHCYFTLANSCEAASWVGVSAMEVGCRACREQDRKLLTNFSPIEVSESRRAKQAAIYQPYGISPLVVI
jgi:hypothetical protein